LQTRPHTYFEPRHAFAFNHRTANRHRTLHGIKKTLQGEPHFGCVGTRDSSRKCCVSKVHPKPGVVVLNPAGYRAEGSTKLYEQVLITSHTSFPSSIRNASIAP